MFDLIAPDWAKFVECCQVHASNCHHAARIVADQDSEQSSKHSAIGTALDFVIHALRSSMASMSGEVPTGEKWVVIDGVHKIVEPSSAPSGKTRGQEVAEASIMSLGSKVVWNKTIVIREDSDMEADVHRDFMRVQLEFIIDAEIARAKKAQWEESAERERSIRGEINRAKVAAGGNPDRDLAELVEEAIARAKLEQGDGSSEVLDQIRKVVRAGPHEHLPAAVANAIAKAAAIAREGRLRNPEPTAKATESSPPEPDLTIAGVALDTAVADKVMSWDVTNVSCAEWAKKPNGIRVSIARRDWSPSTKIRDAMEVWEKVRGKVGIDRTAQIFESENIPLAICRAALEVVGAEVRK